MQLNVYTIFDQKTGVYQRPFYQYTDGECMRTCELLARDKDTTAGKCPSDFVLFKLGTYEDTTGVFDVLPAPVKLALFSELIVE